MEITKPVLDYYSKNIDKKISTDYSKKFVLLDEIDSMTKQAQRSLYKIIENTNQEVCFILICNYFNKIIDRLKSLLIVLSFRNTTQNGSSFIRKCCKNEGIKIQKNKIDEKRNNSIRKDFFFIKYISFYLLNINCFS